MKRTRKFRREGHKETRRNTGKNSRGVQSCALRIYGVINGQSRVKSRVHIREITRCDSWLNTREYIQ